MIIHTVQPGDTLYRIAREYETSVAYLTSMNDLRDNTKLTPGQTIVIPEPAQTYTVRRGDTLVSISRMTGISVLHLLQNNPQLMGGERLYPGQTLNLSFKGKKLGKFAVNGYAYPTIDLSVLRRTLPYLTYLSVFSYGFDTTTGQIFSQDASRLVQMARQYRVRPLLVLTTLGEDGTFSGARAQTVLRNPTLQQALIDSLVQTLERQGYDGVDIDFEYIPPEEAQAYADFIRAVRERLNAEGKLVFVALAPKTSATQRGLLYEAHNYALLGEAANFSLLMTYEWGYSQSAPMAVAPLDKVAQVVSYAVTEIPPVKLLLGIPNYGYDWKLPYVQGTTRAQSIGNVQAVERAIQYGAPIRYDEQAQSPHYNYWRDRAEHEVWFEDARSIRAKLALAGEFNLYGVSIWNLTRYFPQLWMVLNLLYDIQKDGSPVS